MVKHHIWRGINKWRHRTDILEYSDNSCKPAFILNKLKEGLREYLRRDFMYRESEAEVSDTYASER